MALSDSKARNVKKWLASDDIGRVGGALNLELYGIAQNGYQNLWGEQVKFIQGISWIPGKTPDVIMYTENQIHMFKSAVLSGTVIGIDHVYDLGPCFFTILYFRNENLISSRTGIPSVVLGPIFLHPDRSDFMYGNFFSHIQNILDDVDQKNLIFGKDKDLACVEALSRYFPKASMLENGTNQPGLKHPLLPKEWFADKECGSETKSVSAMRKIPELVGELFKLEQKQICEIRRALHGQRNLSLSEQALKLKVSHETWIALGPEQQELKLNKLVKLSVKRKENLELIANSVSVKTVAEQLAAKDTSED